MRFLDTDAQQVADRVVTIASGLTMPNGVAFRDGDLYVGEINLVLLFDGVDLLVVRNRFPQRRAGRVGRTD